MPQNKGFNFKSVPLIFLLIFWKHCHSQMNREEANEPPKGHDNSAFFVLRSCHQLLHGDSGEFFSPDYLCSNPPLWCNWTIQVDPGKRIHIHLEDQTTDDTCHLKQDQIYMDELTGHKVLQKCWREAKYTTSSNTLNVVLLIGGWPSPTYRGFFGRYHAFGPPVVYNPQDGFSEWDRKSEPSHGQMKPSEYGPVMTGEHMESDFPNLMYDYYDQPSVLMAEVPWEPSEGADTFGEVHENYHPASENFSPLYSAAVPTVSGSTHETSRSGREAAQTPLSDLNVPPTFPQQHHDSQNQNLHPAPRTRTAIQRNVETASTHPEEAAITEAEEGTESLSEKEEKDSSDIAEQAGQEENRMEVSVASDHIAYPSERLEKTEQTHPHPKLVEPLSDHRARPNMINQSEIPHLPGDHLFEVAVELSLSQDLKESWDDMTRSLVHSVKALISKQLEALHSHLSVSSKRIKRLNAGVLYIVWLQIGSVPEGPQVRRAIHSALQGLIATVIDDRGNHKSSVIISMSIADVNECGTQLVLCDVNADCVNQFGSYSCHCKPGFQDRSRVGSGGIMCIDVTAAGCSSGLAAETKSVYVLFFLLSSFILLLLATVGVLYHRHHQGAFLVRCHSSSISPPDVNNNHHHNDESYSTPADSDLPPPPPPVRASREGWAPVKEYCPVADLPLLRFSPILPSDGYMEPQAGMKM